MGITHFSKPETLPRFAIQHILRNTHCQVAGLRKCPERLMREGRCREIPAVAYKVDVTKEEQTKVVD